MAPPSVTAAHCVHTGTINPADSPARSIGEDNITFLCCPLNEGHTGVLLPVPHGLPENRPLAAWMGWQRGWDQRRSHVALTHADTQAFHILSLFETEKKSVCPSVHLSRYLCMVDLHRWTDLRDVKLSFSQSLRSSNQNRFQPVWQDQSNDFGEGNRQLLRIGLTCNKRFSRLSSGCRSTDAPSVAVLSIGSISSFKEEQKPFQSPFLRSQLALARV